MKNDNKKLYNLKGAHIFKLNKRQEKFYSIIRTKSGTNGVDYALSLIGLHTHAYGHTAALEPWKT